jgi:hypothetical protein
VQEAQVGCGGHQVQVHADAADHHGGPVIATGVESRRHRGEPEVVAGQRRRQGAKVRRPDQSRPGQEQGSDPALPGQRVGRVAAGSGAAQLPDQSDHPVQSDVDGLAWVHLHPGLLVVVADTDGDPPAPLVPTAGGRSPAGGGSVIRGDRDAGEVERPGEVGRRHDTGDFQPQHLGRDDPVLDDDVRPVTAQLGRQGPGGGRGFDHGGDGRGNHLFDLPAVDPPDGGRDGPRRSAPGHDAGGASIAAAGPVRTRGVDQEVQLAHIVAPGPGQGRAQRAGRAVIVQHPSPPGGGLEQRGTERERPGDTRRAVLCRGLRLPAPPALDQSGELDLPEPGEAVFSGYFLPRRPYRRSKRSTRPPVSTSFCLPV